MNILILPCQPHLRPDCLRLLLRRRYYDDALAMFNSARLDLLGTEERDDMDYHSATCYLKTGDRKGSSHLVRDPGSTSRKYAADCAYYISYIRYTRDGMTKRSAVSCLAGQCQIQGLGSLYITEIYLLKKKIRQGGNRGAKCTVSPSRRSELHPHGGAERILGTAEYHFGSITKP